MSDGKPRKPRSFDVGSLEQKTAAGAQSKKTKTAEKPNTKSKAVRKPKAIASSKKLIEVSDDAAQRRAIDQTGWNDDDLTPAPLESLNKGWRWSRLLVVALSFLVSLAVGLWIDELIRDLFARADWLGWIALAVTGLVVIAAMAIAIREAMSLRRLSQIQNIRKEATTAVEFNDLEKARQVVGRLTVLYSGRQSMVAACETLTSHSAEILDGRDLVRLGERELMSSLDEEARSLVMGAAKRVSVVTAISPRALVDVVYVLMENIRLIRAIAELYGGRPGALGLWRLARSVVSHLAVTGTIAVGDGLLQQVLGHGITAKISTKLGEGVVNGMLTARIGIAAIDVCRPLPFSDQHRPSVKDFLGHLLGGSNASE